MVKKWCFDLCFLVLHTMCLINVSLGFVPIDNYLIDCGSQANTSVSDRLFLADNYDSYKVSASETIFASTNSTSLSSTYGQSLYQTARILDSTTHFTFQIKKQGRHWIRLYFSPFIWGDYNLSAAIFSVSAQNFTLFKEYQIPSGFEVKEYSLNITSDTLIITFTPFLDSFAFLNALEVVSVPDELISDHTQVMNSLTSHESLHNQALETAFRVNMGNQSVLPSNDTLARNWVADGLYLTHSNIFLFLMNTSFVNYKNSSSNDDIAPTSVYGTATMLNSELDPETNVNVTWLFDVDPGFDYLVRFHFCDVRSIFLSPLYFNVYMNSKIVYNNLDLGNKTLNIMGTPYYFDYIVQISEIRMLNVSVGPSVVNNQYPNAILNGLEIMKINNSKSSFDALDSGFSKSGMKIGLIVGLCVGVLVFGLILILIMVFVCKKRKNLAHVSNSQNLQDQGRAKNLNVGYSYPFAAILEATDKFNENLVIGIGGFGKVYKGVLKDEKLVAVKRGVTRSSQGLSEFRTEIVMLSQFRHRHLVSLIGYCDEKNEMIIIYEYMKNGALKNHLYGSGLPSLSWKQRLEICIGSARGLHYLHTGTAKAIIHRDVKSANILLDENLMAKVADFGLSKTGPEFDQTHVSTLVKGSFGYLDPEYLSNQQLTEKSDVYSFGVVLFEVLCGRPVIDPSQPRETVNLIDWAIERLKKDELDQIVDQSLVGQIKIESLRKFGETAEKCLAAYGADRPAMGDVLWNLEYALQLQGGDEARTRDDHNNHSGVDDDIINVSTANFSRASAEEFDGVSLSRVFSEMVKEDIK